MTDENRYKRWYEELSREYSILVLDQINLALERDRAFTVLIQVRDWFKANDLDYQDIYQEILGLINNEQE